MTNFNLEQLKSQLKLILKREVEVERLRTGKFICKYLDFGMPALTLIGENEEEAYAKLLTYLQTKNKTTAE